MFDDSDCTYEEARPIMDALEKVGLEPFGKDWRKDMAMHPLFMDEVPQEVLDGEVDRKKWPLLASHLDMMYDDEDDLVGSARSYKEDGNREYAKATREGYYKAIISYSEGLSKECKDSALDSQLYCNRAAAQFCIGNYRRATQDCEKALKLNPGYLKAINRAIQCQLKLGKTDEVLEWCERGLTVDANNSELLSIKDTAVKKRMKDQRDERKRNVAERRKRDVERNLLDAIKERKLNIYLPEKEGSRDTRTLESVMACECGKVTLGKDKVLTWPVKLIYPEFQTSDLIKYFREEDCLADHLRVMFPPEGESPPWDSEGLYTFDKITAIYDGEKRKVELSLTDSLLTLLQVNDIVISAGMPTFEIHRKDRLTGS